jgi:5-(aminomethyl)-3-furanmethanol phosphate kinase
MSKEEFIVVKVGGSLYDLPSLRPKLLSFLDGLITRQVALFPGGGKLADAIRDLDQCHHLGQESSHWLAVHSLSVAARFLVDLLEPKATCVLTRAALRRAWASNRIGVIDPLAFARSDASSPAPLPRSWEVTSDSLALRVSQRWCASRLILLKSISPPADWLEHEAGAFVDGEFRTLRRAARQPIDVVIENLRDANL